MLLNVVKNQLFAASHLQNRTTLPLLYSAFCRYISISSATRLKKVQVSTSDGVTTVEGQYIQPKTTDKILDLENPKQFCPLCPNKLGVEVKYTDVLILSQFLRPDGCLIPRYITGLCDKAQRRLAKLVHKAQRAGLMPELRPDLPDGRKRTSLKSNHKWRKYNIYYKQET